MTRKELVEEISKRLTQIRESLNYNRRQMAKAMGSSESSYYKNEQALTSPDLRYYYSLAHRFNISLDWLIMGRGEMLYKEPAPEPEPTGEEIPKEEPVLMNDGLRQDVKELLDHMEHIPMLRYEVLSLFQHFKADHKEIVEEAMKDNDGKPAKP